MKILFIVPSYKPAYIYGGTIVVISMLAEQIALQGHDVSVYTTTANGNTDLNMISGLEVNVNGVRVTYFKRLTGDHTHVSPALWKHLYDNVKKFDIVHIHSWWNFLVVGAAAICKLKGVKPVFSPHGMLNTYIMETNNSNKKRWLHQLMGKQLLKRMRLHVSTEMELDDSNKIIRDWRGEIIPNLVKLSDKTFQRLENEIFTIGFLSRIDPKKGLDVLIKALSKVDFEYRLLIAGTGEEDYINYLKNIAIECGNLGKLEWVGWKADDAKFEFLAQVDLFALMSHNENFAIVVIEALSVGTPVLISQYVGLYKYVLENDYGWVTDMDLKNVTQQLNNINKEGLKIKRINSLAPIAIKEEYQEAILAKRYVQFYESTLID